MAQKYSGPSAMCKAGDHPWQGTTAPDVQVCSHKSCGATRKLINGQWRVYDRQSQRLPVKPPTSQQESWL
jgi:hypothetical protein